MTGRPAAHRAPRIDLNETDAIERSNEVTTNG
jgi:hypothetical protein